MDVAIIITSSVFTNTGLAVVCEVATSNGTTLQMNAPINLGLSASQINTSITDAVKAELLRYGVTVPANARIRIFGAAA